MPRMANWAIRDRGVGVKRLPWLVRMARKMISRLVAVVRRMARRMGMGVLVGRWGIGGAESPSGSRLQNWGRANGIRSGALVTRKSLVRFGDLSMCVFDPLRHLQDLLKRILQMPERIL
jgi:hypothetical protein